MIPIRHYVDTLQVRGIVRLSSESRMVTETKQRISEKIVCRSGDTYKQITVIRVDGDDPYMPHYRQETTLIPQALYEQLRMQHGLLDTELYWEKRQHCAELKQTIEALIMDAKKCPVCGAGTELKHRLNDGRPFWGCRRYPACHGLIDIDDVQEPDVHGLAQMFKTLTIEVEQFGMPAAVQWKVTFAIHEATTVQTVLAANEHVEHETIIHLANEQLRQQLGIDVLMLVRGLSGADAEESVRVERL